MRADRPQLVPEPPAFEDPPSVGSEGDDITENFELPKALENNCIVAFETRLDGAGKTREATADDAEWSGTQREDASGAGRLLTGLGCRSSGVS